MKKNIVQGREVGSLYVDEHKSNAACTQWGVYVQGDGSLKGDTESIGIFWNKELAEFFMEEMKKNERWDSFIRPIRKKMKLFEGS
jgi:hypothetical protein